jgi:uncharacterized protein (DUF849 family)
MSEPASARENQRMLQACLNGSRTPREHHHLPVRPEELAGAAAASAAAGATELHLHPKTPDGTDSLQASVVAATLSAVRAAAPGVPVGVTTGSWTAPEASDRIAAVRSWTVLPDHASVTWHEPGADELARALLDRGIGVEAELQSGTDAPEFFADSPLRDQVVRIRVAITDTTPRATSTAAALLPRIPRSAPILLHGAGRGAWPTLVLALERGVRVRIGLEDTLQLPDGSIAGDNAELVAAALAQRTGIIS